MANDAIGIEETYQYNRANLVTGLVRKFGPAVRDIYSCEYDLAGRQVASGGPVDK